LVKVFKNRNDIDFDNVEGLPAVQEFNLQEATNTAEGPIECVVQPPGDVSAILYPLLPPSLPTFLAY